MKNLYDEIVSKILSGEVKKENFEKAKSKLAKKYMLDKIPKNADIIGFIEKRGFSREKIKKLKEFLLTKPVRTGSGVSVIAVMKKGRCPGKCVYCPRGSNAPQSYTGVEPATLRAKMANYDPYKQVANRIRQLEITGHRTDKCELIIMGGTFPALQKNEQENFVMRCLDAMNGKNGKTLKRAQKMNESAKHRCVGLTIETRPDYCGREHINQMLKLGATRVEIGVQTLDNEILRIVNRGHDANETAEATRLLKDCGLKCCYHMMPGLTGLYGKIDMEMEKKNFDEIFSNPDFRPDMLKIYPTLVIPGTKLFGMWKRGRYKPMTVEQAIELILHVKSIVPKYVRIQRVQRDISSKKIVAGPVLTNLRQKIQEEMRRKNITCNCIRCREVGHRTKRPEKITLQKMAYDASRGKEFFISYEDVKNDILIGYLRLRIPHKPFRKELKNAALVRELHVYGEEVSIGLREKEKWQHRGYGKKLLEKAEQIARQYGMKKIAVTSGVGARKYYEKFCYRLVGAYMVKNI